MRTVESPPVSSLNVISQPMTYYMYIFLQIVKGCSMQKHMQYKGKSISILILIFCVFFNLKSIFSLFLYLEVIHFVFTYILVVSAV